MEFDSTHSSILIKKVDQDDVRRSVKYHPSVWGDYFLAYVSMEISATEEEELRRQKEMVRKVLARTPDHLYHKLELIDAIQRLGVGYHFEEEIDKFLQFTHDTYLEYSSKANDLRIVALRFRLLRQHGYPVSCDIFNKFIDGEGNFKVSLIKNVEGMLELFEAAQFRIAGEKILEKALEFSSSNLESSLSNMNSSLSTQVKEALKIPILKSSNRVGAKKFISIYQQNVSHSEILLNFAKLDFNIIQKTHQKELSDITRWWKDLDFANKLPFARDRVVECYFWAVEVYFEPHYHIARKMLTKIINMTSILDDIYDVYGTLDDLQLFTDLIQRWDVHALEQLPSYMRICYEALSDVYIEMENELKKTDGSYRIQYAKEEMKKLVRAYLEEAKWSYNKDMPRMEEYMKVASVTSAYMMLLTTSLVGMGNLVTKKDFDWITSEPLLLLAFSTICRLTNDLVGYGFEKKPTAVECYMNENGASKEEAFAELQEQVTKAWKDMNQESLRPTVSISMPVLTRVLNFTRIPHLFYVEDDEYTNSEANIRSIIYSILVEANVTI
ncbi:germacrene-D synthase-like [Sesamum indicum]|uniref:Germacrene-D synthase-like n=1 Tax=Sesamum indicum TaxID=4182 RepID=A0A8M8VD02_SESIN|nr:germacrene-D synthase-like [Sesamum indicum]